MKNMRGNSIILLEETGREPWAVYNSSCSYLLLAAFCFFLLIRITPVRMRRDE